MRVLTLLTVLAFTFLSACSAQKPDSPQKALDLARAAWLEQNAPAFTNIMSTESKKRINSFIAVQRTIPDSKRQELENKLGLPENSLTANSLEACIEARMQHLSKAPEDDLLARAFKEDISTQTINDQEAIYQTTSGLELRFLREGNLWLFDLGGYF